MGRLQMKRDLKHISNTILKKKNKAKLESRDIHFSNEI